MSQLVVIVGATGDLGGRIVRELSLMNTPIRALVRNRASDEKKRKLQALGAEVVEFDFNDHAALTNACAGASVVVSAVAGLRDVIVDLQTQVLNAAVAARVPRFIPSDFAIDFTKIPAGANRNLNFRSEFQRVADRADIRVTSILSGAFTDMLTGTAPFVLFKIKRILCWGDCDRLMDWTTMDDTARFTAHAARDEDTPRFMKIAGDVISANDLAKIMTELTGEKFRVLKPGGLRALSLMIRATKVLAPQAKDVYPAWQGMQYMHNMYSGIAKFDRLDNSRYPMKWKTARDVLAEHLKNESTIVK